MPDQDQNGERKDESDHVKELIASSLGNLLSPAQKRSLMNVMTRHRSSLEKLSQL